MKWKPGGFLQCSLGVLTLRDPNWNKACLEPSSWGFLKPVEHWPSNEEIWSCHFKWHRKVCSQSSVSHNGAQKAFGTLCTSTERNAHAIVLNTVRHTRGKAFHWLRLPGNCCSLSLVRGKSANYLKTRGHIWLALYLQNAVGWANRKA